jgi:hypothetical protein
VINWTDPTHRNFSALKPGHLIRDRWLWRGGSPDPIPNSEVKPRSADGTAGLPRWESTSPPIHASTQRPRRLFWRRGLCASRMPRFCPRGATEAEGLRMPVQPRAHFDPRPANYDASVNGGGPSSAGPPLLFLVVPATRRSRTKACRRRGGSEYHLPSTPDELPRPAWRETRGRV